MVSKVLLRRTFAKMELASGLLIPFPRVTPERTFRKALPVHSHDVTGLGPSGSVDQRLTPVRSSWKVLLARITSAPPL